VEAIEQALSATDTPKTFSVLVMDMYHSMDREEQSQVDGFQTYEAAREYVRRRTRDSVQEERPNSTSPKDLEDRWYMFGEDCLVMGGDYSGGEELDFFIANPATPEERNWTSLSPDRV
jgi:hypothetical protein